jgi:hypothetical protein
VGHFRGKDKSPNKLGGNRTHFWLEVGRSVNEPELLGDGSGVQVAVSHPVFAHKVKGGQISAKRAKALTIPLTPEAYGRRASVFERETGMKLFLLPDKDAHKAFLATEDSSGAVKRQYLLTPSVDQQADPTAMPDESRLREAVVARAVSFLGKAEG